MTWPLQPIGPRPPDIRPIAPVDRPKGAERRRTRDEPQSEQDDRREREPAPGDDDSAAGEGRIDLLA